MEQERKGKEDQRKIPRYTDNELSLTFRQTKRWIYTLITTCILIGVFELIYSLMSGLEQVARGIFFVTVFFIFAGLFKNALYTMNLYLQNNSQTNLRRYHNSQNNIYMYLSLLVVASFILSLFMRF